MFTQQAKDVDIEWLQNKKVMGKEKSSTLTREAQKVEADFFSCNVSNRVSFMTSDPVKQTCFKPSEYYLVADDFYLTYIMENTQFD